MPLLTSLLPSFSGESDQSKSYDGEVSVYSSLPSAASNSGKVYLVETDEGVNQAGFYRSNGSSWLFLGHDYDTLDDIPEGTTNKHFTATDETKLDYISVTQDVNLDTIESDTATNNAKVSNATHTGDVTGSTALTIADEAVTHAKLAHVVTGSVLGRTTAGTGDVETLDIDTTLKTALSLTSSDVGLGNVQNINVQNSFTQNDAQYIGTDEIRAKGTGGLKLYDDASNGIFIEDGGHVGIGTTTPEGNKGLHVAGELRLTGSNARFNFQRTNGTNYIDFNDTQALIFRSLSPTDTNVNNRMTIDTAGDVTILQDLTVNGALSKGSGSFDIAHPDPLKNKTHRLRHYFVETPSAGGNIYKYQLKLKEGFNTIDLPDYFNHLNKDSFVWVCPYRHFGSAWGEVKNAQCEITTNKGGTYNVLIFADRNDQMAIKEFNKYGVEYKKNEKGEIIRCL